MTSESIFRAVSIGSTSVCLSLGMYYRIKSRVSGERLARVEEGVIVLVGLRLCGVLAWALFVAYLINPAWVSWCSLALPAGLRWTGAFLAVFIVPVLLHWTFRSLGKNLTDTVVTRREHTLVTHGPYRFIRHPFYLVVFIWGLSLSLLTANWVLGLLDVVAVTMLVIRTRTEEAKLADRFGEEYLAYARRTGKFFPLIVQR